MQKKIYLQYYLTILWIQIVVKMFLALEKIVLKYQRLIIALNDAALTQQKHQRDQMSNLFFHYIAIHNNKH